MPSFFCRQWVASRSPQCPSKRGSETGDVARFKRLSFCPSQVGDVDNPGHGWSCDRRQVEVSFALAAERVSKVLWLGRCPGVGSMERCQDFRPLIWLWEWVCCGSSQAAV
jgi:hypothetical protein